MIETFAQTEASPKNLRTLLYCSILILTTATVFAVTGDAPHVLLITLTGLVVSALKRRPLPRSTRSLVYAIVFVLLLTVLGDQVMPVSPGRFFLLPAQLYCPAIIYLAVAATWFDQRDTTITAIMALALIGTMLAGNTVVAAQSNPRLPLSDPLLQNDAYFIFYAIAVVIQVIMVLVLLPQAENRHYATMRKTAHNHAFLRQTVIVLSLLLVFFSAAGLRQMALSYERSMQRTFTELFQRYMQRRTQWLIFGNDVDLWRTVPMRAGNDRTVVLRAVSEQTPGYLRGRVYETYSQGRWTVLRQGNNLPATKPEGRYVFTIFNRELPQRTTSGTLVRGRTDILPSANFRSDVLLAPGNTPRFELVAEEVVNSPDGVLQPHQWDWKAGYSFYHQTAADPAYPLPAEEMDRPLEVHLSVPADIRDALIDYSDAIFTKNGTAANNAADETAAILRHFRQNFSYELGVKMQSGRDPVLQFLEQKKHGHCELFATAAVLMLRVRGIPARYVTGFVCNERHPAGTHWLARLQDAHAWAEAYLVDEQRWVTIEATPATGVPAGTSEMNFFKSIWDRMILFRQEIFARMKRGYVAEAITSIFVAIGRSLYSLINHPIRGPLLMFLALLLLRNFVQKKRQRQARRDELLPRTRRELMHVFLKLERQMQRQGLERRHWQTIGEYARAIQQKMTTEKAAVVIELLREYEMLRYQPDPPPQETVAGYARKVRRQLRSLRNP